MQTSLPNLQAQLIERKGTRQEGYDLLIIRLRAFDLTLAKWGLKFKVYYKFSKMRQILRYVIWIYKLYSNSSVNLSSHNTKENR